MARLAALAAALVIGVPLAGCAGLLGPAGFSLPSADGVQTVSDVADALDAHRTSGSENAKSAIAVTDAMGSFVRDVSADQRAFSGPRTPRVPERAKRIASHSELVFRTASGNMSEYCEGSAGYSLSGIPSLDVTFGWEGGAFSGGTRTTDGRGSATWTANATGAVVQGAIGSLSIARSGMIANCPMTVPAFTLKGGTSASAFSIPIALAFHHGELSSVNVPGAHFSKGESLYVTTDANRGMTAFSGIITKNNTQLATFRTNAAGSGMLTITSTGAQYVIADWIVVGT